MFQMTTNNPAGLQNQTICSRMPMPTLFCPTHLSDGLFQAKAQEVAESTQAPWPLVVQGMLSTTSLLFQGLMDVEKPNGQISPCSLYTIGIAQSGERKSAIAKHYLEPIYDFLRKHTAPASSFSQEQRRYREDLEVWHTTRRRLIQRLAKIKANEKIDPNTRHERIEKVRADLDTHETERPSQPPALGLNIFSDITPAGLHRAIRDQDLKSVGLISAEGEELVENGIQRRLSALNGPWSGEPTKIQRVSSGSSDLLFRLTLYVQMQPNVAYNFFSGKKSRVRDIGLAARALITYPASTQGQRTQKWVGGSTVERAYKERVLELLERNQHAFRDGEAQRAVLRFSEEAKQLWLIISDEIERAQACGGRFESFPDHAAKLADNIARVSALIHAFENDLSGEISKHTLENAINICFFFSDEFVRLMSEPAQEQIDKDKMLSYLQRLSHYYRYIPKSFLTSQGPLRPADRANLALVLLGQEGIIALFYVPRQNRHGKPIKPREIIDLYPGLQPDYFIMNQAANSL